jgi:LysM repeat protein
MMRKKTNEMKNHKQRPAWVDMFAKTGRVESRGGDGRDWHTDVPNIKLSRAFVVVLVLHVVAVGGILAFEMVKPDTPNDAVAKNNKVEKVDADKPAAAPIVAEEAKPRTPAAIREQRNGGYERYIVQPGDSIRDIAGHYRISRAELLAANRIDEMHPLVQGRILRIPMSLLPDPSSAAGALRAVSALDLPLAPAPTTSSTLPAPSGTGDFATIPSGGVSSGGTPEPSVPAIEPELAAPGPPSRPAADTAGERSAIADSTGATLRPEIVAPRGIIRPRVKRELPATTGAPTTASASGHTIAPGDTLYGLSRKYKVSVDKILAANPGVDPRTLKIGQKLKLP